LLNLYSLEGFSSAHAFYKFAVYHSLMYQKLHLEYLKNSECLRERDVGWDSIVIIVTCHRPDGPGQRQDFLHPSRPALGLTHPPVQWVQDLFSGVKWWH